ncbi:hypothetical protein C8J57DRAFT_1284332 [Mycena rebaudengoi]|nr:hypothetical protein C8J57DRAFT_1284332 [Mycena rebaudengoi]
MLGPRSPDSHNSNADSNRPTSLHHQRSTKLLISRFESLSSASGSTPIPPVIRPLFPPFQDTKKEKSPIRQSFRNLLAVFKKGSGLLAHGRSNLKYLEDIQLAQGLPSAKSVSGEDHFIPTTAVTTPHYAGSLFYLARSPDTSATPPVLPVWSFCTAALEGDTMNLTWPTTPAARSILLKHCTDVHSLSPDQLDPEERALLPGDLKEIQDIKVFEILFEGRAREKFATTSVRERARWVSAIWDAILPKPSGSNPGDASNTRVPDGNTSNHMPVPAGSKLILERALPPVPGQLNSPLARPLPSSPCVPVSPSIYPSSRPESRASHSPSITNLSHLSVVKQLNPHDPVPSSPSPSSRRPSKIQPAKFTLSDPGCPASPTSILDPIPTLLMLGEKFHHSLTPDFQADHCGFCTQSVELLHSTPLLAEIHHMISCVAQRTEQTDTVLHIIQDKLEQDSPTISRVLEDIREKLQSGLTDIQKSISEIEAHPESKTVPPQVTNGASDTTPSKSEFDKFNQILEILKQDALQRSIQSQQQTDSVRYLNELNSWLEAFVSGGTARIQVVAAGVDKLCKELGCSADNKLQGHNTLLADIRQMSLDFKAKDQSTAMLQRSVNSLVALLNSESGNLTPHSIAGLVERQRQDQEDLLRVLTAELTNEIRGERLRFVDAMKEATQINVQMHVEQLKNELAREVRADLFAFYSKQKHGGVGTF